MAILSFLLQNIWMLLCLTGAWWAVLLYGSVQSWMHSKITLAFVAVWFAVFFSIAVFLILVLYLAALAPPILGYMLLNHIAALLLQLLSIVVVDQLLSTPPKITFHGQI